MLIELFVTASISLMLALFSFLFYGTMTSYNLAIRTLSLLVIVSTLWWTFGLSIVFEGNSVMLRY
ncbi:MAG: hypothetical protein ACJ0HI_05995 [Gammaproteobacteria bacterium]